MPRVLASHTTRDTITIRSRSRDRRRGRADREPSREPTPRSGRPASAEPPARRPARRPADGGAGGGPPAPGGPAVGRPTGSWSAPCRRSPGWPVRCSRWPVCSAPSRSSRPTWWSDGQRAVAGHRPARRAGRPARPAGRARRGVRTALGSGAPVRAGLRRGRPAALAVGRLLIELYRGRRPPPAPGSRCSPGSWCSPAASRSAPAGCSASLALALTVLAGLRRRGRLGAHGHGGRRRAGPAAPGAGRHRGAARRGRGAVPRAAGGRRPGPAGHRPGHRAGHGGDAGGAAGAARAAGPGAAGRSAAGRRRWCSPPASPPSLRPRLAAVGGLLALAVVVLGRAVRVARRRRSPTWSGRCPGRPAASLGCRLLRSLAAVRLAEWRPGVRSPARPSDRRRAWPGAARRRSNASRPMRRRRAVGVASGDGPVTRPESAPRPGVRFGGGRRSRLRSTGVATSSPGSTRSWRSL